MHFPTTFAVSVTVLASVRLIAAQTSTTCNPLEQTCPADTALGTSVSVDFTSGASSSNFKSSGAVTYGSNGAAFTVAQSGDSPTLISNWYFMFGHVDFVIQAAPGAGIVSSAVLISDCLDEIDWEWLGYDNTQVQSNYFGKGQTTTYNRGAYNAAPNNQNAFTTYSIDWTADQIVWQVNGVTVRVLTQADAAAGQYPQTPMQIKVGAWSGGDSSNAPGTIQWAHGPTNYAAGPFTMYLKSIHVSDYSTGTSYSYSGTAGTWQSVKSSGGTINSSGNDTPASTAPAPGVTSAASNSAPMAFGNSHAGSSSPDSTPNVYPWVSSATASIKTSTATAVVTSISGLPSGWTVNSSGKVVPPSSGSIALQSTDSSDLSASVSPLSGAEVITTYDQQGFPTTVTIGAGASMYYNNFGSLVTTTVVQTIYSDSGSTSPIATTTRPTLVFPTSTVRPTTPQAMTANEAWRGRIDLEVIGVAAGLGIAGAAALLG